MRVRSIIAVVFAVNVAAVCIRLGLWQLDRHRQRQAINALVTERMERPPVQSLGELASDTGAARYRAVELSGTWDFENEFVLIHRASRGSPGVNLLTPLRIPGEESAVLVNRGWVYSPDGMSVDLERWREPSEATVRGYALPIPSYGEGSAAQARSVRRLDHAYLAERIPYPLAPIVVVDTATPATAEGVPGRLDGVALDDGPHLGYAMQWFSFAAIALIGVGIMVWRDRRPPVGRAPDTVVRAGSPS
jgi:surfeit locus 1 family protein